MALCPVLIGLTLKVACHVSGSLSSFLEVLVVLECIYKDVCFMSLYAVHGPVQKPKLSSEQSTQELVCPDGSRPLCW